MTLEISFLANNVGFFRQEGLQISTSLVIMINGNKQTEAFAIHTNATALYEKNVLVITHYDR